MKKTVFDTQSAGAAMLRDFNALEKQLSDIKDVLCCIAFQQDDLTLTVPVAALAAMPRGVMMDISYDQIHQNYVFKALLPDATTVPESTGFSADDKVASGLG